VTLLSEPLTWFHIAGLVLILTGSVLASRVRSSPVSSEDVPNE
jgi:drug/metabolite transporter (DMT)-like permease